MADERARKLISLFESEKSKNASFYNLFQRCADLVFPRENNITRTGYIGEDKFIRLIDTTAVTASLEMVSGLSQNLVPAGQKFFGIEAEDDSLNQKETVKRVLSMITDVTHRHLFGSNFVTQLNETLRSWSVFGTGNIYSDYVTSLSFRDYDISNYIIMENFEGIVDTMLMKFEYTASQAVEKWGDNSGKSVIEAMKNGNEKKQQDKFEFLHIVRPREKRNPRLEDFNNMEFESIYIAVKDIEIIDEGGFVEFPYHVARYTKASNEVYGRGQGLFILNEVRMLQNMRASFIECANKHNNPPLMVSSMFEGDVNVTPGAINNVENMDSIKSIPRDALGNFVITREVIKDQQTLVKNSGFLNDIFVILGDLSGDRRTTLEIRERLAEGFQRLGPPIGRFQRELFDPLIGRVVGLLNRNGQLPPMPEELAGQPLKISYLGRLAMELKSYHARGFQQLVFTLGEMEAVIPGIVDNINGDVGARQLAEVLGVQNTVMATIEEVAAKREARVAQEQAAQAAELAATAAEGYSKTKDAPEEGSPMEDLVEANK